jgi:dihydrofolate reductase
VGRFRSFSPSPGTQTRMATHNNPTTRTATTLAALRSSFQIHGLAVVSNDGYIGRTATDITFDWSSGADKEHFFCALDRASLCIMGRKTHQLYPNKGQRSRLVISRSMPDATIDPADPHASFCNIDELSPYKLLQRIASTIGTETNKPICVLGGSQIYRLFLEHPCLGFDSFELTVETKITHDAGVSLFPAIAGQGLDGLMRTLTRSGLQVEKHDFLTPDTARISLVANERFTGPSYGTTASGNGSGLSIKELGIAIVSPSRNRSDRARRFTAASLPAFSAPSVYQSASTAKLSPGNVTV